MTNQYAALSDNANILVVDDAHQNLQLLSEILTKAGHCVRAARDGRIALESALQQPPDLVLLDIRMPVIDGLETCRQLKAHAQTQKVPVIFISALEDSQDKVAAFDAGGVDYILKPFQANEVLSRVNTHLALNHMQKELENIVAQRTLELEKSNQALRQSEMRYRMLFEKAGDAILMLKVNPPDAGRITEANHAAASMHGYTVEEMIGMHITDLDSPEDAEKSDAKFERILSGEWLHDEITHIRKDGTLFPTEISAGLIQIGTHRLVLAFIRDISNRKKMEADNKSLEEHIRQANKIEAIGTLASGIAHDFNNILFAISGFTELSIQYAAENSIIKQNLMKIQRANRRAAELVSQILTLSRKKDSSIQTLQPKIIIKEALKLLRATLPSTIEIQLKIQSNAYVEADATQIHQIIMNLCVNANHAMEASGGVLTIQLVDRVLDAPAVQNTLDLKPGPYVELTVADTGKGIADNIKDWVFDPYFTTKPQEQGTGLGLAVVHSIVKSYSGQIEIESKEGQGCKVTVLLPIVSGHQEETLPEDIPLPKGEESVLFVDDEAILIDIGRQMLEILGYRVTTRSNGPDALALYRENPEAFDLVITDYTMPKMTGPQLAAAIHEIKPEQPIILVSGMETPLSETEARQLGIRSFIRKPVILKEIASAVRTALGKPPLE